MASITTSTCDQCRLRKIKCSGGDPCVRCRKAQIDCSRNYIHRRRGPKTSSGRIIRQIRNDQSERCFSEFSNTNPDTTNLDRAESIRSVPTEPQYHSDTDHKVRSATDIVQPDAGLTTYSTSPNSASMPGIHYTAPMTSAGASTQISSPKDECWRLSSDSYRLAPLLPRIDNLSDVSPSVDNASGSTRWRTPPTSAYRVATSTGSAFSPLSFVDKPQTPVLPRSHPTDRTSVKGTLSSFAENSSVSYGPAISSLANRTGLPALLFTQCLKQYFRHLHASYPVLQESRLLASLGDFPSGREYECLLLSVSAFTMLRAPPMLFVRGMSPVSLSRRILSACLTVRGEFDWIEKATLMSVITSYFLCMIYYDLEQKRSYEHHLSEAIQLAHADDLVVNSMGGPDSAHAGTVLRQRVFVLLYITNRSDGVQRHKAVSRITRTSIPSLVLDPGDEPKLEGLQTLTNLFDLVGDDFMDTWLSSACEPATHDEQSSNLSAKKRMVDRFLLDVSNVTETQQPDLLVSLRWLRLAYWQLLLKKGLVSSTTTDQFLSYQYPVEIAQDLCDILHALPVDVVFRHGRCILEKIFDITYALIDCLAIAGTSHNDSPALTYLHNYLSCAPEMHSGFVEVLQKHIDGYAVPMKHSTPA